MATSTHIVPPPPGPSPTSHGRRQTIWSGASSACERCPTRRCSTGIWSGSAGSGPWMPCGAWACSSAARKGCHPRCRQHSGDRVWGSGGHGDRLRPDELARVATGEAGMLSPAGGSQSIKENAERPQVHGGPPCTWQADAEAQVASRIRSAPEAAGADSLPRTQPISAVSRGSGLVDRRNRLR